jgi:protein-tyrosine kinase
VNEMETAAARPAPAGTNQAQLAQKVEPILRGLWASVFYAPASPPKSVLVCSANHKEGATTVACGLAVAGTSEAERARVVLVDFNLRSPSVNRLLRLSNRPGVSEVLTGQTTLDEALRRVGPGQLDVLTAGGSGNRMLEVLETERVKEFLNTLQQRYDYVVMDAAPANPYPDAQVLAGAVGGVLLVAVAGHTPREALAAAKRRLEAGAGKVLGVVLNMRSYPIPKFLYRRV